MPRHAMLRRSIISLAPPVRFLNCAVLFLFLLLLVGRLSVSDTTGSVTVPQWLCLGPRLSLSLCRLEHWQLGLGSGIWAGAAAAASPKLGVFWGGGFAVWVRCVVCVFLFSSSCISYAEIDLSFSLCALFFACCLVGTGGCGMDGYGVARWKGSREKTKNG